MSLASNIAMLLPWSPLYGPPLPVGFFPPWPPGLSRWMSTPGYPKTPEAAGVVIPLPSAEYLKGDVLDIYVPEEGGWGNYFTVMEAQSGAYQIAEGWYPRIIEFNGKWIPKSTLSGLQIRKVGHVSL